MESMTDIITQKLEDIEQEEGVRIIYACESGSRAWGFASPDSDYDVRFIYVRNMNSYLTLEPTRDVIEWQLDETLDINGWDIKKALQLLYKANPVLFEWNNSPIVYKTTAEWALVQKVMNHYFDLRTGLNSYLGICRGQDERYFRNHDDIPLKKYFYVLRPILACRWILDKKSPPPMLFDELVSQELDDSLKILVSDLVTRKKTAPEKFFGPHIPALDSYVADNMKTIDEQIALLPCEESKDWDELNNVFKNILFFSHTAQG